MEPTSERIVEEVKNVCSASISAGKQADLTVRNILDELVSIFSVDAVFFKQKPIKALVKTTAFIALQETSAPVEKVQSNGDAGEVDQLSEECPDMPTTSLRQRPDGEKRVRKKGSVPTEKASKKDPGSENADSSGKAEVECVEERAPKKRASKKGKANEAKSAEFVDSDGEPMPPAESVGKPSSRKPKRKSEAYENSPSNGSKPATTKSKASKTTKAASSDDKFVEEIKRLKSYISACGVNKRWKQEFEPHPTPQGQIKHLKSILTDLGMPSRCSMAKAKEIRQQRELEDELNQLQQTNQPSDDDVPDEGSRRKKKARTVVDSDAEEGSDAPKAKRNPYAFLGQNLGDDSD